MAGVAMADVGDNALLQRPRLKPVYPSQSGQAGRSPGGSGDHAKKDPQHAGNSRAGEVKRNRLSRDLLGRGLDTHLL